jgi:peptidoglycan hydrolase-like protein with peptidoglycan-binding domain
MLKLRDDTCGCADCAFAAVQDVISGPVSLGKGQSDDIEIVQTLLNNVSPSEGGPALKLVVDGKFGPKTNAAVVAFQKKAAWLVRWSC